MAADDGFDDASQWYWAAGDRQERAKPAGDRFVIASGQRALWSRVTREISLDGKADGWNGFGPKSGKATLADCFRIFITAREHYGANYNRAVLELAQVPAFARFIKGIPSDLGNWVSNPTSCDPLPREVYTDEATAKLGARIAATLNLAEDWWR
jgi:hypothetical protein